MRLAAIDIGSNGARLLIKNFRKIDEGEIQISRVMYMRVPLRLGTDVFTLGKVSKARMLMMKHTLKAFKQIMKLNLVDDYRACATSAMRDADNGKRLMKHLAKSTGIKLEIIDGKEEALLLCNNLIENIGSPKGNFAYVDVGGGSTEISILHDGALMYSHSYNIGTLRMLGGMVTKASFDRLRDDMQRLAKDMPQIRMIGSGGNINKLYKLSKNKLPERSVAMDEVKDIYNRLKALSVEERIEQFGLKADRADVIIPASEIFITIADALGCDRVQVPNICLADCITDGLYRGKPAAAL